MRFFGYSAALLVAGLMFVAPTVRADMITLTISDGTTSYTATGDAATGVSLNNGVPFTLDGVKFVGASAFTSSSGGESVTFGATLSSGKNGETSGKSISYTITDASVPGAYTSFQTTGGFTQPVASGTTLAMSTVNGTSDANLTIPNTTTPANGVVTTIASVSNPTSVTIHGTIVGFNMTPGKPSGLTVSTLLNVPEPNGVLLGLLGLPCLGGVVYFARRRSSAMALVA
jgi:hypothetical protein